MKSAERVLARNEPEEAGHSLSLLRRTYTAAAMWVYCLDDYSAPFLIKRLLRHTLIIADEERWADKAVDRIDDLIVVALVEAREGAKFTLPVRAAVMEVSERTWSRHYAKPYEAIYGTLVSWYGIGRTHVFRRVND